MIITPRQNQKMLVFLTESHNSAIAHVVVISRGFADNIHTRTLAPQRLTREKAAQLRLHKNELALQNVFVIEISQLALKGEVVAYASAYVSDVLSLSGNVRHTSTRDTAQPVYSPYVSNIFDIDHFLTTQQTRGPNSLYYSL